MSTLQDAVDQRLGEPPEAEVVEPEAPPLPPGEPPKVHDGSVLAQLRKRAAQLQQQKTVDLPIPGYEREGLFGRYRAVSITRVLEQNNVINPIMPEWFVAADVLATALQELLLRNTDGKLEPFAEGVTLRFDDDLVAALDLHPDQRNARGVLKALLGGGELGESRISTHFMRYQGWLMGGDGVVQEVADLAVGESPGQ